MRLRLARSKRLAAEECLDFLRIGWLDQVGIKSGLDRTLAVLVPSIAGERHQKRLRNFAVGAKTPGHLVAVQLRQAKIQEDYLRLKRSRRRQCSRAVVRGARLMATELK